MNVLDEILATTREAVERRKSETPHGELARAGAERVAHGDHRSFRGALTAPGPQAGRIAVIAEHKRRSPSAGVIREGVPLADIVRAYERAGAAALSILTEESRFDGSLADLQQAREATRLPVLRKDFIVDPYQVHEALAGGADAILLIVAALDPDALAELHELATKLELDALVEVHDRAELEVATNLGAQIIGINNRDLATLKVDTNRTYELLDAIPAGTVTVAESGFRHREELDRLADAGVDAVLVGEALMRSPDIEAACRALTAAPAPGV